MPAILDDLDARARYLAYLEAGEGRHNAAKFLGTSNAIVKRYMVSHPDFAESVAEAENAMLDPLIGKAYELALAGDLEAIKFILKALDRDRFGDKSVVDHNVRLEITTGADLKALAERLEVRQAELERGAVIDLPPSALREVEPQEPAE